MFDASPNAYVIFDRSLDIVGCNASYLSAVGRESRDEIVGRNLFEAFPADTESLSYRLLRGSLDKVLATGEADHIALIPYDTSGPGEAPNLRYWSATHTPIFDSAGHFRYILQHTVDVTELQMLRERSASERIAEAGLLRRAQQVQAANQALLAESEMLRDMFKQAPGFIGILVGPQHTFALANDAYQRLVGGRNLVGLTVAEALPEVVDQGFVDLLDQVYSTGKPFIGDAAAVMLRRSEDATEQRRYVDFVYQPILDEGGSVSGIFVQGQDVTEKVEAAQQQTLRHRELGHRLKNQLAMVQAIANQTIRSATNLKSAGKSLSARLQALAGAHESLIVGASGRTTVDEIVRKTLEILDETQRERFTVDGPALEIASRPALSLSLILHELTTNAVKYGALSGEAGAVDIAWGVEHGAERRFVLQWREHGGAPVSAPAVSGAGTRLIRAGLAGTVDCRVTIDFEPGGVACSLSVDLASFQREQ